MSQRQKTKKYDTDRNGGMADGGANAVRCRDALGRDRVMRVYGTERRTVGLHVPPGEWVELTPEQLRQLITASRDRLRDAQFAALVADIDRLDGDLTTGVPR